MSPYTPPEILVDDNAIIQMGHDIVALNVPGYVPRAQSLLTAFIETGGQLAAEQRSLFSGMVDNFLTSWGVNIAGLDMHAAIAAQANATFTLSAAAPGGGVTIPIGTQFYVTAADGSNVAFTTRVDLVIAAGATTGVVQVYAAIPGAQANGLSGAGIPVLTLPPLVTSISIDLSTGGQDPESQQDYLDRLSRYTRTATRPSLVLAVDAAELAMNVTGVARAMAIDNYDPAANTYGNERYLTVVPQGTTGAAVSGTIKTNVDAYLQSLREANMNIIVVDPLVTAITVVVNVVKRPTAISSQVQADVQAALKAFLDPLRWGGPTQEGEPLWSPSPVIYLNDVLGIPKAIRGVDHVTSATINGAAANLTMQSGKPHAIPDVNPTVTVNVT